MAKKSLILLLVELLVIFLWLFFVGQISGTNGLSGDINMIDEGQFAAWVNHMLHGKMMYRDFFVPYGPLQVYPLYILVKFFFPSMFFVRLWVVIFSSFLGICVALLVIRRLKIHPFLAFITIIFLVIYPGINIRQWLGILSLLVLTDAYVYSTKKLAFISGVLIALSFLQSIDVGIFTILISTVYILIRCLRNYSNDREIYLTRVVLIGFISVFAIFALLSFREGWLGSYITATSRFTTAVSGINLPNGQGLPSLSGNYKTTISLIKNLQFIFSKSMLFYWSLLLILLFFSITIIRFILKKNRNEDDLIFLIISFDLLTYASIIGRSGHHLLNAPVIVICGSYFISLIFPLSKVKDLASKFLSVLFLTIFLLYIIRYLIIYRYTNFLSIVKKEATNTSVSKVSPLTISKSQANDILPLQEFFSKNTKPSDTIFIFNNIPALYFLLDRENSTKYDLPILAISHKDRLDLISSLQKNPPKFILEDKKAWPVDEVTDRQRLPEVAQYIEKKYKKAKKIGHFVVYQMN